MKIFTGRKQNHCNLFFMVNDLVPQLKLDNYAPGFLKSLMKVFTHNPIVH
jgi:hypothetical protein